MVAAYPLEIISASTIISEATRWLQAFATKEFVIITCNQINFIWLHVIISGNLAMAVSTLKEINSAKSSRQGSSSHLQLSIYIPMVISALKIFCS